MTYCQDCGAANDTAATFCRICGRGLSPERSDFLCPICTAPLAQQAAFCSACGVAVMRPQNAAPAPNFAFAGAGADNIGSAGPPAAPAHPIVQGINESLDLPDWLKRAAAEQPPDASQATDGSFMYTGANHLPAQPAMPISATQTSQEPSSVSSWPSAPARPAPPSIESTGHQPTTHPSSFASPPAAAEPSPWSAQPTSMPQPPLAQPVQSTFASAAPPLMEQHAVATAPPESAQTASRRILSPEIPNGGLDRTMPSWLNEPPKQVAPAPIAPAPAPAPSPVVASTDTTSFISESDLPAWIRQLAEAEEVRKAEETAQTALAARKAVADQVQTSSGTAGAGQNLFGEGSLARRISQLPGEAEPPTIASNPWLTRHEQSQSNSAAQSDVWSRPMSSIPRDQQEQGEQEQANFAPASDFRPDPSQAASPLAPVVNKVTSTSPLLRIVLLGAVLVSVLAIIAYVFLLGGS
jgi:Double zinc ribbon